MIKVNFVRQEVEALIDLLEQNPEVIIHDKPAKELADELREMISSKWRTATDEFCPCCGRGFS